jgi:hypothetical protein
MTIPTTMIGSLPFVNAEDALGLLDQYPLSLPAWPQLPKRSFKEAMTVQYSEGFPGIRINEQDERVWIEQDDALLNAMATFYELVLAEQIDPFAISPDYAQGLHGFVRRQRTGNGKLPSAKGQSVGPVTLGLSLSDSGGKAAWFDEQYRDVVIKGLAAKAVWQVRTLAACAEKPVLFLDEPIFSALGTSAYLGIQDEDVIAALNEIVDRLHAENAKVGSHCCGNMDWSLLTKTSIDIIAFDAFSYGDKVTLYPDAIAGFLDRGGILAWGIVPTASAELVAQATAGNLKARMVDLEKLFTGKGISRDLLLTQRMLTPSCGMGNLAPGDARRVLELLSEVAR